jgi:hypothetical protein
LSKNPHHRLGLEFESWSDPIDRLLLLVFVDCQLAQEEGKMKGSTKSRKMDEPFNM